MTPYHRGELTAQQRAGVRAEAEHVSPLIGHRIPPSAQAFLAAQPMLVVGAADLAGDVWATMLTGRPGFVEITGDSTVTIAARPTTGDPLHDALAKPVHVGMIVIEPGTRRRIRINGTSHPDGTGLRVDLEQVYPNCPKYIQEREPEWVAAPPHVPQVTDALTPAETHGIGAADTFFVATTGPDGDVDASHRGGNPGFVRVLGPTRLRWPEYAGNSMLNTLGNLELDPRAGLLFPDWATGSLLHLTGTAVVDWDTDHAAREPGAQRLVDFEVRRAVQIEGASPLRWSDPEFSRFNPVRTGASA